MQIYSKQKCRFTNLPQSLKMECTVTDALTKQKQNMFPVHHISQMRQIYIYITVYVSFTFILQYENSIFAKFPSCKQMKQKYPAGP